MSRHEEAGFPALNVDAALAVLERALYREVTRVGFEGVVLGLSGGIDSALVAYLAARSFGPQHVLALMMPYATSSPDSLEDARRVVDDLGIEAVEQDITPQIDAYFAHHPDADAGRRGNKMARERMTILYDWSMQRRVLVLATSNKTELLLGYSTIFGDSAGAILPIGDLYKTQVRELSRHLGVPGSILDKKPSADLYVGQTDEQELGFTYAEVDPLLFHLVDRRASRARMLELGFDADLVEAVRERMQRNHYKRKLPVILKLSGRTVDKDFLYSRDWTG